MMSKNLFWGKAGKKSKISLRTDLCEHGLAYSCHVSWKYIRRKWPTQCMVFLTVKGQYFPFSPAPLERSRRKFCRFIPSPFPIRLSSFVQIITMSAWKAVGFSPTKRIGLPAEYKQADHIILFLRPSYSRNRCHRHTATADEYTGESETTPCISRTDQGTHG